MPPTDAAISSGITEFLRHYSIELNPGDSIAFDSSTPHEYWNTTDGHVHAIWVVVHTEPGRA